MEGNEVEEEKKEIPYFVQQFTEKLPEFVLFLKQPSKRKSLHNSSGIIKSPFGFTRLRVLEFVVGLMGTGYPNVTTKLLNLDIFKICIDLFFEYKWNNFIHHQVYLMISRVLNGDPAITESILKKSNF